MYLGGLLSVARGGRHRRVPICVCYVRVKISHTLKINLNILYEISGSQGEEYEV
jgi:hypothetical protein